MSEYVVTILKVERLKTVVRASCPDDAKQKWFEGYIKSREELLIEVENADLH